MNIYGRYGGSLRSRSLQKTQREELHKGFYSIGKKIYQDDGEVVNEGFA